MTEAEADQLRNKRKRSRIGMAIQRLVRTRLTTGIITILPVLITVWVVQLIFVWMRDASRWVIKALLLAGTPADSADAPPMLAQLGFDWAKWQHLESLGLPHRQEQFFELMPWHVQWGIAFFSVAVTIFFLYVVGLFAANIFGRRAIESLEQLVDRVPLIKTVYRGLKQILASFTSDSAQSFRRAALVPFPQEKMRCVGFITNTFKDSHTGEELCSVFIATTPNPTTGYLQILKRADITELPWTVEESIRCVMSGGILKPDFLTMVPNKDLPEDQRITDPLPEPNETLDGSQVPETDPNETG